MAFTSFEKPVVARGMANRGRITSWNLYEIFKVWFSQVIILYREAMAVVYIAIAKIIK